MLKYTQPFSNTKAFNIKRPHFNTFNKNVSNKLIYKEKNSRTIRVARNICITTSRSELNKLSNFRVVNNYNGCFIYYFSRKQMYVSFPQNMYSTVVVNSMISDRKTCQ